MDEIRNSSEVESLQYKGWLFLRASRVFISLLSLSQIVSMAAYCEVMQGILLVVELILPTRNIMYTVIWWQYLQARWASSCDFTY